MPLATTAVLAAPVLVAAVVPVNQAPVAADSWVVALLPRAVPPAAAAFHPAREVEQQVEPREPAVMARSAVVVRLVRVADSMPVMLGRPVMGRPVVRPGRKPISGSAAAPSM